MRALEMTELGIGAPASSHVSCKGEIRRLASCMPPHLFLMHVRAVVRKLPLKPLHTPESKLEKDILERKHIQDSQDTSRAEQVMTPDRPIQSCQHLGMPGSVVENEPLTRKKVVMSREKIGKNDIVAERQLLASTLTIKYGEIRSW